MVERNSPVPEEIRPTPSVSDYVKVRKRGYPADGDGTLPQPERLLSGGDSPTSAVRLGRLLPNKKFATLDSPADLPEYATGPRPVTLSNQR